MGNSMTRVLCVTPLFEGSEGSGPSVWGPSTDSARPDMGQELRKPLDKAVPRQSLQQVLEATALHVQGTVPLIGLVLGFLRGWNMGKAMGDKRM